MARIADPDTPQKIIESTIRLIDLHGLNKITMEEIAEGAGISKAALYLHYSSKKQLAVAAMQSQVQNFMQQLAMELEGIYRILWQDWKKLFVAGH